MKYYTFYPDFGNLGVEAGGQVYIQFEKFTKQKNFKELFKFFFVYDDSGRKFLEFPDFDLEIEYFELEKKAILTDFLNFGPVAVNCYVISEKVYQILQTINLPPHKFYPTKIYPKTKFWQKSTPIEESYRLLYMPQIPLEKYANIPASLWYLSNDLGSTKLLNINIEDEASLAKANSVIFNVFPEKVSLTPNFSFDFFVLHRLGEMFISEKAKEIFTKNKVTGLKISNKYLAYNGDM